MTALIILYIEVLRILREILSIEIQKPKFMKYLIFFVNMC